MTESNCLGRFILRHTAGCPRRRKDISKFRHPPCSDAGGDHPGSKSGKDNHPNRVDCCSATHVGLMREKLAPAAISVSPIGLYASRVRPLRQLTAGPDEQTKLH